MDHRPAALAVAFCLAVISAVLAADVSCPNDDVSSSVCGNGILEPGETCDVIGAACCQNCQFVEPPPGTEASADDALICRLRTSTLDMGVGIKKNPKALFRYYSQGSPKEPLPFYAQAKADGSGIKLAWTDNSVEGENNVGVFDADRLHITDLSQNADGSYSVNTDYVISGRQIRGMYAHYAGWTAVLVRTSVEGQYPGHTATTGRGSYVQNMVMRKYQDADGSLDWETPLENDLEGDDVIGRINDFALADGRLAYGDGKIGAYYKVSTGEINNWHEGDTLKTVDENDGTPTTVTNWGCSHSMELRLAYNPETKSFAKGCISDAFPSKGLHLHGVTLVKAIDANGGGYTDGGLGQMLADGAHGFLMIFTAPKEDDSILNGGSDLNTYTSQLASRDGPGADVGVVRVSQDGNVGPITWLTSTTGADEMGAHITPYGADAYMVSWRLGDWHAGRNNGVCGPDGVKYYIATIRQSDLSIIKGPEEVTKIAPSMERDDFFTFPNGDAGFVAPGGANKQLVVQYETELSQIQVTTMKLPRAGTCGNGRIEPWAGETCDDDSSCCVECHLKEGAQCSQGGCCDTDLCVYKAFSVTCAIDGDTAFDLSTCGPKVDNCGSCVNGVCGKIPGQTHGNTGWCPAGTGDAICKTKIAYKWPNADGPSCMNNFYSEKTVPEGTICAVTPEGLQQLCEIPDPDNAPDNAVCGTAGTPIPTFTSQPPCPHCSVSAGAPCTLSVTWPELDALELSGAKVYTGGLGSQMDSVHKVWVCMEASCAPDDLACFRFNERQQAFDWWGFNSHLRIITDMAAAR